MTRSFIALVEAWRIFATRSGRPQPPPFPHSDIQVERFVEDSRAVKPGDCFVARVRPYSDGHPFIGDAVKRGAVLVIAQHDHSPPHLPPNAPPIWLVDDTADTLNWLAAAWHQFPGESLITIGVTGTDGKTTISNLLYEILTAAKIKCGMISTIKAVIGDREEPTGLHVTTPQAPQIQAYLRQMVDDGCSHSILETTSMGLAERRADAALFNAAIVSNVQHEHIDYHGDWKGYLAAKQRLFELADTAVILNRDDQSYSALLQVSAEQRWVYGLSADTQNDVNVTARNLRFDADATRFTLQAPGVDQPIETALVGRFNVYNMLAAAAAALALGVAPKTIAAALANVEVISGRMERIDEGQPFLIIVDFAHTPNALEQAIAAARTMCSGRIITVFGSAGRRDVQKRRMMAEIAAEHGDLTVLTAEDPRQEPLESILEMMATGCRARGGIEGQTFWRVHDRGRAIYHALQLATAEDLVLICGKGHEQSMCFGDVEFDWDDRDATRTQLRAFLQDAPPVDLGLPTFPTV